MEQPVKSPPGANQPSHQSVWSLIVKAVVNLRSAYGKLGPADKVAAICSLVLIVSEALPWYRGKLLVVEPNQKVRSIIAEHSAIGTFSPIEIALLVTAGFVLFLLFMRAEGHALRLPISDGTVIAGAGAWAILLILVRSFDRPEITFEGTTAEMGLRWGIFVALMAAIVLALVGLGKRRPGADPG